MITRIDGVGSPLARAMSAVPVLAVSAPHILGLTPLEAWVEVGALVLIVLFAGWILIRRLRRRGSTEDAFDSSGRLAR